MQSRSFHSGSGGECCCQHEVGDVKASGSLKLSLHGRLPPPHFINDDDRIVTIFILNLGSVQNKMETPPCRRSSRVPSSFFCASAESQFIWSTPLPPIVLAYITRSLQ